MIPPYNKNKLNLTFISAGRQLIFQVTGRSPIQDTMYIWFHEGHAKSEISLFLLFQMLWVPKITERCLNPHILNKMQGWEEKHQEKGTD